MLKIVEVKQTIYGSDMIENLHTIQRISQDRLICPVQIFTASIAF